MILSEEYLIIKHMMATADFMSIENHLYANLTAPDMPMTLHYISEEPGLFFYMFAAKQGCLFLTFKLELWLAYMLDRKGNKHKVAGTLHCPQPTSSL